ncbi:uncharacterized protein BJX67DRAFT_346563 [Aspergillus lucknowensis]|uniref:Uncharacterized protein n=1 Tax=Aspergillus lucknowensis TaxID=176173 RepID=A0ABR4LZY8_9EURO
MRFLTLVTVFAVADVANALPDRAHIQMSCIGLNDRYCNNSTVGLTCCPPLRCGRDSRCH